MMLNGIEDVVSFDEYSILMQTVLGVLSVDGSALHIMKMNVDSGEVIIEGEINGLFYIDNNSAKNIKPKKSKNNLWKYHKFLF